MTTCTETRSTAVHPGSSARIRLVFDAAVVLVVSVCVVLLRIMTQFG